MALFLQAKKIQTSASPGRVCTRQQGTVCCPIFFYAL